MSPKKIKYADDHKPMVLIVDDPYLALRSLPRLISREIFEVAWVPDEREVAEVFTVPVSVVLDPGRYKSRVVRHHGRKYTIYSLRWNDYDIWGATAGMLMNLILRMRSVDEQRTADFAPSAE